MWSLTRVRQVSQHFVFKGICTIPRMNSFRLAVEIIFVVEATIFSLFRPLVSAWPSMLWNFEKKIIKIKKEIIKIKKENY